MGDKPAGYALGFLQGYKTGYAAALRAEGDTIDPEDMKFHFVQKNDTLTYLAEHFDTTVEKLKELNPNVLDPDLIYEGDVLRVA